MPLIFNYLIFIFILLAILVSSYFLITHRPEYPDISYYTLVFMNVLLGIWLLELPLIDIVYIYHLLPLNLFLVITRFLQIFGMVAAITLAVLITNQFTSIYGKILSRMSIFFFSGTTTMLLADLYFHNAFYLDFILKDTVYFVFNHLYSLYVILGSLCLTVATITAYFIQRNHALKYYPRFQYDLTASIVSISLTLPTFLFFSACKYSLITPSLIVALILSPNAYSIALFVIGAFYLPFFNVSGMFNLKHAIKKGYIGYLVSYTNESGPKHMSFTSSFMDNLGLTNDDMFAFTIRAMTVLGSMDARWEGMYLIPFSPNPSYLALSFNFILKNPQAKDIRLRSHTPVMLTLFISKTMRLKLTDIESILTELNQTVQQFETIQKFLHEDEIMKLIVYILRHVLN